MKIKRPRPIQKLVKEFGKYEFTNIRKTAKHGRNWKWYYLSPTTANKICKKAKQLGMQAKVTNNCYCYSTIVS